MKFIVKQNLRRFFEEILVTEQRTGAVNITFMFGRTGLGICAVFISQ